MSYLNEVLKSKIKLPPEIALYASSIMEEKPDSLKFSFMNHFRLTARKPFVKSFEELLPKILVNLLAAFDRINLFSGTPIKSGFTLLNLFPFIITTLGFMTVEITCEILGISASGLERSLSIMSAHSNPSECAFVKPNLTMFPYPG